MVTMATFEQGDGAVTAAGRSDTWNCYTWESSDDYRVAVPRG